VNNPKNIMFVSKWRFLQTIGSRRNCAQSLDNDDLINVVVTPKVKSSLFTSIRVVGFFVEELKDEYREYSQPTPQVLTSHDAHVHQVVTMHKGSRIRLFSRTLSLVGLIYCLGGGFLLLMLLLSKGFGGFVLNREFRREVYAAFQLALACEYSRARPAFKTSSFFSLSARPWPLRKG
jgi:hypothetical protein